MQGSLANDRASRRINTQPEVVVHFLYVAQLEAAVPKPVLSDVLKALVVWFVLIPFGVWYARRLQRRQDPRKIQRAQQLAREIVERGVLVAKGFRKFDGDHGALVWHFEHNESDSAYEMLVPTAHPALQRDIGLGVDSKRLAIGRRFKFVAVVRAHRGLPPDQPASYLNIWTMGENHDHI